MTFRRSNKAGYTATPVACGWAGAIFEVSWPFGQERWGQKNQKSSVTDRRTDGPTKQGVESRSTRLKIVRLRLDVRYFSQHSWDTFYMRPRISTRNHVRPSVGLSFCRSLTLSSKHSNRALSVFFTPSRFRSSDQSFIRLFHPSFIPSFIRLFHHSFIARRIGLNLTLLHYSGRVHAVRGEK